MEAALKMALKKQPQALIEAPAPASTDKKATMSLARRLAEEQDAVGAYRHQVARLEERLQNESTLGDRAIRDTLVELVSDDLMLTLPPNLSQIPALPAWERHLPIVRALERCIQSACRPPARASCPGQTGKGGLALVHARNHVKTLNGVIASPECRPSQSHTILPSCPQALCGCWWSL